MFDNSQIDLDFLTIRLKLDLINKTFFWINQNSCLLNLDFYDYKIYFDTEFLTHNTYNLVDKNNNKLCQILIVNKNNKKSDLYNKITFYWTYFNLYWLDRILSVFNFFWITDLSIVTRIDYKIDFDNALVSDFCYKDKYIEKVKTFWTTWKSLEMNKRYKFRVYNKRLDILDKNLYNISDDKWYKKYYELLHNCDLLTRLELQLNSRYIKDKWYVLKDLLNFDIITNCFKNSYVSVFQTDLKKIRDNTNKKTDDITLIKYEKKVENSKVNAKAYLKKLYFLQPDLFKKNLYEILDFTDNNNSVNYAFDLIDKIK